MSLIYGYAHKLLIYQNDQNTSPTPNNYKKKAARPLNEVLLAYEGNLKTHDDRSHVAIVRLACKFGHGMSPF